MSEEIANILIVDSSKLVRVLTSKTVKSVKADNEVLTASTVEEAKKILQEHTVDMLITSLRLSDGDGIDLCQYVRKNHRYIPVLVVSGDVDNRVQERLMSADVTDYLDKSKGQSGLEFFIKGIISPDKELEGHVLYIEDSRVVAHATKKILSNFGLTCDHVLTVTAAIELLGEGKEAKDKYDVILTDYYLKDNETAQGLVDVVRQEREINKMELPFVVMTGDENETNQKKILKTGANDLVLKPVNQDTLMKKVQFQIRFKQFQQKLREKSE
jgi:CheY-like chemotaxis protein